MFYHFSEDPNIKVFTPRPSDSFPHLAPMVWAIDQDHSIHYYFPRDCPRVIFWKTDWTNEKDEHEFFSNSKVDKIIVIENQWLEQLRNTKLYVYFFAEEKFNLFEEAKTAGYYISSEEIVPIKVEPVGDLMERILSKKVELRFTPDLFPIKNRVASSTLDFSIIRFRNATKF